MESSSCLRLLFGLQETTGSLLQTTRQVDSVLVKGDSVPLLIIIIILLLIFGGGALVFLLELSLWILLIFLIISVVLGAMSGIFRRG
jgi:hypothetical protein